MQLIDGRKIRDEILIDLKKRVEQLPFVPVFCDVLVGDDLVSRQYVDMKEKIAQKLGIQTHRAFFEKNISTEELIFEIKKISEIPNISGIIVQLPLQKHINTQEVLNNIPENLDVDVLGNESANKFYANEKSFIFPTALAILHILKLTNIDLADKNIVVVGQGVLVGKPITHLLLNKGLKVFTINENTQNKNEIIKNADVVISATGNALMIKGNMLKSGVVLIDAGTSESSGGVVGDVDYVSVGEIASAISPTPGGVGPVTVAMLMQNLVISAESKIKNKL